MTGFSVSDYVARPFPDVVAATVVGAEEDFAKATSCANLECPAESVPLAGGAQGPSVELGEPSVTPWGLFELPVRWRAPSGTIVIEGTFRLLPVEGGRDRPVTELLLHCTLGTEVASRVHPVGWARRIVELVAQSASRDCVATAGTT